MKKAIPKQSGHFKSFDGTSIYYEIRGEGKPLIFCYGIGCLINHWRHQIRFFSKQRQTIAFDYRGHHKSETPANPEELTLDSLANDIKALMEHLDIKSADFMGHSFGVPVLINTHQKYPQLFEKMVFINGFATNPLNKMFGNDVANKLFQAFKKSYVFLPETLSFTWKKLVDNPVSMVLSGLLGGFNLKLTEFKDIQIYARAISRIDLYSFLGLFESMSTYDGTDHLGQINNPVFVIAGNKDSITPSKKQFELHQRIPNSEYLSVPYASHCTQLDAPDYINLKCEKFLNA